MAHHLPHHHHHHHQLVDHVQTHLVFDPNSEIYNLATGVEMIGFHPKPTNNPDLRPMGLDLYHHDHDGGGFDHVDESSLRTCVFPCEGNERPSQGLSLSVSSSNPSSIGLQSFELRHQNHHHHDHHNNQRLIISASNSRDVGVIMGKSQTFPPQEEVFLGKSASTSMSMQFELMRNSKYLGPTQELLYEFCNLGTNQNFDDPLGKNKNKKNKEHLIHVLDGGGGGDDHDHDDHDDDHGNIPFSSSSQSLYGLSLLELQKRKKRLLGMLEELDRRYKRYCEQMKTVVSSFEAVASTGAANVYSALASKAMSRHFRCLRDSIVAQIKATNKAMGEKDASMLVPGTTKGETPRLRILDQALRQQRAFQQMTMMETHPWRPQRGLPERSVSVLRAWLFEHFLHPYPSDVDKHILARQTGLTRGQVSNWFINARVRLWKPMVEQMYLEETKDQEHDNNNNMGSSSDVGEQPPNDQPHQTQPSHDKKPTPDQLVRIDPECLSSIINTTTATNTITTLDRIDQFEGFGSGDSLDFPSSSSYHHHQHQHHHHQQQQQGNYGTQNDHNTPQGFGGGNVSLTLGLQQHGQTNSLFYGTRDHIGDCQPVQYSLLDGDQGQNLRYRNLMGAQLLHDFA